MREDEKRQWNLFRLDEADIVHSAPQVFDELHTDLTSKMREILIGWIIDVCTKFCVCYEVFFGTITLCDRFLASPLWKSENAREVREKGNAAADRRNGISRDNLQCVGTACLYIMSLLHERYSCEVRDLVYITDKAYSRREIVETAHRIVFLLDGDVHLSPTPFDFLKCLTASFSIERPSSMRKSDSRVVVFQKERQQQTNGDAVSRRETNEDDDNTPDNEASIETIARFFLERASFQWRSVISRYRFSVCACAALVLAHTLVKKCSSDFLEQLSTETGVSKQHIVHCAYEMFKDEHAEAAHHSSMERRYFLSTGSLCAAVLLVPDKDLSALVISDQHAKSAMNDLFAHREHAETLLVPLKAQRESTGPAASCQLILSKRALTDVYEKGDVLGSGTYGVVRRAVNKTIVGLEVAVKIFTVDQNEDFITHTTLREVSLMCKMDHPNIARVLSIFFPTPLQCCITMPLMEGGSLRDFYKTHPTAKKDKSKRRNVLRQICSALAYMHNRGITHRDLKSDNIVLDGEGKRAMLIDFGLARSGSIAGDECFTGDVCTLWYKSPELLLGDRKYDAKALDIWSLACVFAEMASTSALFAGDSEIDQLFRIFRFFGTPNEDCWPGVERLPNFKATFPKWTCSEERTDSLRRALGDDGYRLFGEWTRYVPSERLSAHEALRSHPYFQDQFVAVEISQTQHKASE